MGLLCECTLCMLKLHSVQHCCIVLRPMMSNDLFRSITIPCNYLRHYSQTQDTPVASFKRQTGVTTTAGSFCRQYCQLVTVSQYHTLTMPGAAVAVSWQCQLSQASCSSCSAMCLAWSLAVAHSNKSSHRTICISTRSGSWLNCRVQLLTMR